MLMKIYPMLAAVAAMSLGGAAQTWACAVCLTGADDASVHGFNASVLFLMSTPYLVMGAIVGALVFSYRRARKRREAAELDEHGDEPAGPLVWNQEESGR